MILFLTLILLAFYLTYSQIYSKRLLSNKSIEHMADYKNILPITPCSKNIARPKLISLPVDWFKFFSETPEKFKQKAFNQN